jgi:hypothetical protein
VYARVGFELRLTAIKEATIMGTTSNQPRGLGCLPDIPSVKDYTANTPEVSTPLEFVEAYGEPSEKPELIDESTVTQLVAALA